MIRLRRRLPLLLWLSLFLLRIPAGAAAPSLWAQGDPSPDEQAALEWINRARANPVALFQQLAAAASGDAVLTAFFAAQQPATPAQLLASLQSAYSLAQANSAAFPNAAAISSAPLALYPLFQSQAEASAAAAAWPPLSFPADRAPPAFDPLVPQSGALLSGPAGLLTGPNATGGTAQFGPYGANYVEETDADLYSAVSSRELALSWLCAPGSGSPPPAFLAQGDPLPDLMLGHTRMAGVAVTPAGADGSRTLAFVRGSMEFFTADDFPYGPDNTVFITGVAYRDQNGNGQYDSGEGLSGVQISLDHGGWAAVTATAGGYAIPVPANSGACTVTAASPTFGTQTATVQVAGDNVKLDWVLPPLPASLPPQVAVPPSQGSAQLVNLSARGLVEAGADELVAGFVIAGPPGSAKSLLIRGVGPSLQNYGLPAAECIPATSLQLFSGPAAVAANTGWTAAPDGGAAVAAAAASCGAFPLTRWAGGGGDSALVVSLPPGLYSAVVTPAPGAPPSDASGHLGLVEVYDLSPAAGGALVNLSARGAMGAGDAGLVLGATVGGSGAERLLIRAAGPALAPFGISPVLPNPYLTLYDAAGSVLATNDDWSDSPQTDQAGALAAATGAFPFTPGSVDSALIVQRAAGSVSAAVTASPGTPASGIALVEVYAAP